MIELKVKAVSPLMGTKFPLPAYATAGAAAMDLCACMEEPVTLAPGGRQGIPTGIAIALPGPEYVALVCSRSGMGARHGITLSNSVGVIDSDYRGQLTVGLVNHGDVPYTIQPGDRIAQLMVLPILRPTLTVVEEMTACGVDICGENGEFHTIAVDGPVFHRPIPYCVRQLLDLGDYSVADITVPEKE